jgi:N-acetylmuramoyl-L-alanine amidase
LSAAKNALQSSDEIEQFRGYNELKTLYLRANLDKNSQLSREALEGIVQGGTKLGIDVSKYEADLAKMVPIAKNTAKADLPEKGKGGGEKPSPLSSKSNPSVAEKPVAASESSVKFLTPSPVMLKNFETKHPEEVSMTMRHRLAEAKWKDSGLELLFDTAIKPEELKMSKIIESDKHRFRYIIDIDSATLSKSQTLEHSQINRIKMAQFDAKTLRLVIEHNHPIAIKAIPKGTTIFIDLSLEAPVITPPLATPPPAEPVVQAPPLVAALPPLVNVTPRDRSKKIIVIDAGHGGKDSGAVGNGFMEKEIVLQIASQFGERLRHMGYTVHMTRSNDTFIELKDRTKLANDRNADLFISVHANSIPKTSDPGGAQGIETYFLSPARSERSMRVAALENSEDMEEMGQYGKLSFLSFLNKEKILASNKLAIDLQKGMLSNLRKQFPHVKDNGVREAPFWVLVGAQMPAVLVEVGYISHPEEASRISDDKYQKWMVEGLLEGVGRYFANSGA